MSLKEIIGEPIDRMEAISVLKSNQQAYETFLTFEKNHQEDIIAFVQGKKAHQSFGMWSQPLFTDCKIHLIVV